MAGIDIPRPPKTDCAYVYDCLRNEIMSGRISPNERVVESYYAEKLGVSRTPVREALRLLERDGLVNFQPKRGATVRDVLREDEVEEVFRLRALLQMSCVKETVERITPGELAAMAGCNGACAAAIEAEEVESFFRNYDKFNKLLLEASKMPLLHKLLMYLENFDPITSISGLYGGRPDLQVRHIAVSTWKLRRRGLREHMAIWTALEQRDEAGYAVALRIHLTSCDDACREGLRMLKEKGYM